MMLRKKEILSNRLFKPYLIVLLSSISKAIKIKPNTETTIRAIISIGVRAILT